MSAVVGRLLLAVGIGVITAVVHNFFKNRREQHAHHFESNRRQRRPGNGGEYRPSNAWRDDDDDVDTRKDTQSRQEERPAERHNPNTPECHICFEAFEDLTRRGKQIISAPCGHVFCKECLTRAFIDSKLCPRCRASVPEGINGCRPIFL